MSISVEQLHFSYGSHTVLSQVSFSAEKGQVLAILGPNGVGKTTLFRCILGLLPHYSGTICLDGSDARQFTARQLAHHIAYIPQSHTQTFSYSALEMVLMGTTLGLSPFSAPGVQELTRAEEALAHLGIAHLAGQSFLHLSGGEQQLVLIARALAQQARTLLMDEPTASLDYGNQALVLSGVRTLADEGYTVLLSTHNPQHALWYADRAAAILDGQVAASGVPACILTPELIRRIYGVTVHFQPSESGPLIVPEI